MRAGPGRSRKWLVAVVDRLSHRVGVIDKIAAAMDD
jgi:hypothetical protein